MFSQRYERGSTLVTSNLPFDEWTEIFGSERLTGALLDRLTHHVHILEMNGESYRLNQSRKKRKSPRGGNPHDGEIITHAPNLMWGTDGVRVFTVDDGWGWIFTAVEHWNAECVGWHVCKRGDRFAALQPISMGLAGLYGSTAAGAARGLALRMDHGSQYLSDHFTNQIKFWGIQPSYAFVAEPQTNGVAERFNRTLKEQIIHGRIYRNIAELRDAVRDFVELYNAQWIVEKNGLSLPFIPSIAETLEYCITTGYPFRHA